MLGLMDATPFDGIASRARASFGYRLFTAMRYLASTDGIASRARASFG